MREGRFDEAALTFERLVRAEPLHEEGYRGLIIARAKAGDRAGAEREFRRFEGVLRREGMGSSSPALRAMAGRVQRGEAP